MARDELEAFDDLEESEPGRSSHQWQPLEAEQQAAPPSRRGRTLLIVVLVAAVAALVVWRLWPEAATPAEGDTAPAAAVATRATSSPTSTYVDGNGPQAVETAGAPAPSQVSIPAPAAPKVKTSDPESVTKAWVSAINNRDTDNLDQVQDWTQPYSALHDLDDLDPYGDHGAMGGKAPTVTKSVTLTTKPDAKPVDSSTRRTRLATVVVQSHTGQQTEQRWTISTMKDDTTWKVTSASLDSWTGKQ